MLPAVTPPKEKFDPRMETARKLAAELFAQKYHPVVTNVPTAEQLQQQAKLLKKKEKSIKRTLKLISDPQCNAVYSMKTELRLITERNMEILHTELSKLSERDNIKFSTLVEIIDRHMQLVLFGCSIDIGICTDSTAKVLEFFGDPNYRRKVRRGDSNCFTAIDRKDLVVEAIPKHKNPMVNFTEGDHVVYVPMFGTSSAQGVMEIYGLQTLATNNAASRAVYQRAPMVLKAMMQAKDYKFVNSVRLWKKPPTTPKVLEDGEIGKFYGVDAFIVAGLVTGVAQGRRGVPFYGGPRYTVTWENGETDEDITATDLLNHYKETPQSLGCSNTLDEWLSDQLYDVASTAGRILEKQRVRTFLLELRTRIQRNNMKSNIIVEIGLEAVGAMINGTREVSLVGFNTASKDSNSLVDFFPARNAKNRNEKAPPQNFYQTVFSVSQTMMSRAAGSEPYVLEDNHNTDWIAVEMAVAEDFVWSHKANYDRYFVVMNRNKALNGTTSPLDLLVLESVVGELSAAIKSLWAKELRKKVRKEVLKDLEHRIFDWKSATVNELCYNVIQHITPHLKGADVYVGLVDPGGASMTYVASSTKSKMEGKTLKRGEGVSFDVIDSLNTIILRPEDLDKGKLLMEGSIVDVFYGKKLHRCKIEKNRGHEKFDVRYDIDHKVEAGVDVSRIVPHSFAFRMKKFGKAVYPFVCVALKNRTKSVGVLGIDSFTHMAKAEYDTHPDADLVMFLEKVGNILGTNIDIQRKKISMQALYVIAKNQFSDVNDVMTATFDVLYNNLTQVTGLTAVRYVYEDGEKKSTLGIQPIMTRGNVSADLNARMDAFNPVKSSLKAVQKFGERMVFMLCRLRPAIRGEQGRIFIIGLNSAVAINDPDLEFLAVVQKLVAGTLQNIVSFKAVTELRYEALRDVKGLCEVAHRYSRQKFFNAVVDSVQSCFYSANMYVGVLSPYNRSLDYILASSQSDMVGKSLARTDKNGVSFQIIDELKPLGVGAGSPLAFRLFHFGPRQQFEFPYIGIPLIVHVDAVIGVLGVDNCEDPAAVSDQLTDTTSFFNAVGTYLGQVVRKFREEDAKIRLLKIARESPSYAEGIRQIKKVLLEVLPFAKRVVEIVFEPTAAEVFDRTVAVDPTLPKQVITHTVESYTVLLHVPAAFLTSSNVKSGHLKCIWQGNSIFSCRVNSDGETKLAPVLIHIPNAVSLDIVKIQFVLNGLIGSVEREVAHKEVDLVYLLNAPLYLMEHYLESPQTKTARVGRFQLLSKVFSETQVVGFSVTEIQIKGITNLFDTFSSHKSSVRQTTKEMRQVSKQQSNISSTVAPKLGEVFTVMRWNDELIKKTPALAPTGELSWSGLDIYLKMESILLESNTLQLEVWDERKNGEAGTAYGRMTMTASSLRDYMEGTNQWLEMGALLPETGDAGVSSASILRTNAVIRMKGKVVTAAQMTRDHMDREFNSSLRVKVLEGADGNKERQFHSCELRVICARELGRGASWPAAMEPNVFTVVYFNGEEIGRTPVVKGTTEPSWEEELFKIRVPGDEELEQCVLLVELIHLDGITNIEQKMGRVEVQGKALASFLTSNKLKCQWFDVQDMPLSKRSTKHVDDIVAQGELMLSGRPTSVEVTGYEDPAKELGHMEFSLLSFANVRAATTGPAAAGIARTFAVVYFNGRKIHRTKTTDGKADGAWDKEKVIFRYPNNKPLYQCVLRIELWHMRTITALKSQEVLLGSVELTTSPLGKLMGQKGLITKWLAITPEEDALDTSSFSPEIQVKGGPHGGADIFEDCDEHLLLDILAATRLPLRKESAGQPDTRPNTFCEVTWNQKRIGRTAVVDGSANPLWDRQRFIMRIPLITTLTGTSILSHCKLRLNLFDVHSDHTEVSLGALTLLGTDLENLFSQVAPKVQWFPLRTALGPDGKVIENSNEEDDDEDALPAELKLRGAKTGVSDESPKRLPDEHLLEIISARDLSNTDIFGGADSFVVVEYMGDEIGKTQIVPKTVSPVFHAETFILKPSSVSGSPEPPNLCLSVYSKLAVSTVPVFLGRVLLGRTELNNMMSVEATGNKQFTLTTSPELTEEENRMVKGALTIKMSKIKNFAHDIATKKDALLWIQSASNLPKTSAFGNSSDVFCKVFRRADREGGEDIELYQTEVAKTLSPTFKESYIPVEIPAYEDWSGFQIRIEVWDVVNEPIGALILREGDAQKLFGRDSSEALTPLSYELLDGSTLTTLLGSPPASAVPGPRGSKANNAKLLSPRSSAERPTVSLVGGLKGEFENALKSRPESPAVVFEGVDDVPPPPSQVTSPAITRFDTPTSTRFKSAKNMYAESASNKAEVGDEAIISIASFDSLLEAEKLFCILKWKKVSIGRTTTASPMDAESKWSSEQFKVTLDPESALTSAMLDIEVFSTTKRDAPMGVVALASADIVKLFDPATTDPIEFPILDFRGPRTLAARKRPVGSVSLKGTIPRLQREYDELRTEELKQHAEIQEDPELHETEFELCLLKASELSRASRSMEVFATVYWCGKEEPVWKTEVVSGSINPVFDAEICEVKKPQGVKYADCSVRVVLHNKNFLSAHTFLGELLLTGEELRGWIASEGERTFPVAKSTVEKGGQGDAQGSVTLFIKKIADTATSPMFNNQIPLPSHLIEMELNVLAANGLAKVNTLGLSNPFCKLHWGHASLGQTSVVHDTLSPLWEENDSFTLRTPSSWDFKKRRKPTKNAAALSHNKRNTVLSNSEMTLTISVFNWSRLGEEVFMGCAEIQGEELAKLVSSGQYSRKWFNLGKSHHLKQRDQKFVQGRVQILLTHKPKAGEGDFSGKDIELMVCAGRDLVKRKDNIPVEIFVRSRWNGKVLGKTFHSFDPVAPLWEDERFHARLPGSLAIEDCLLELEVWQHQKSNGKSILAGVVSLSDAQLRQLVEESNFSPTWFYIAPSPFMSNALVSPKRPGGSRPDNSSFSSISDLDGENLTSEDPGLGQIQIRCGFGGKFLHITETTVAYDFSVLSAKDLGRADLLLGQSDPFVICKWNSREIGRTPHASRTTNPVWTDQNFLLMIDPNEDIGQNLLQVEVWNHRVITKGEFLGCLNFTGPALVELYNNLSKHGRCLCDLEKSTTLALNRQHLVKGKLEIGLQLRRKDDSASAMSIKESLNMQWSDIWAEEAGAPLVKFQLCSAQNLPFVQNEAPLTTKGKLIGATPAMSSVSCSLSWLGEEVVRTAPVTLEVGHRDKVEWADEIHHFKVPADADETHEASILVLKLWDTTHASKPVFMGRLEMSFKSLWTLYGGLFTFALQDQEAHEKPKDQPKKGRDKDGGKVSAIRGTVTFRIAMLFPYWDSIQSIVPRSYLRKLTICGAVNLPLVDDEKPNTKCVVIFDGAIKAKTIVMLNNIAPSWPRVDIDIIVDKDKPVEITVIVYHVNASDKKEVIIGQEIIPFEYLLRPPATVFDLFLGPGPKRITEFKFTTSGSARLQVTGSNKLSESSLPFSHRLERPAAALVAKDVRGYGRERLTKLDHELNGELLSPDERLWLGTATDFVNPQLISCRPEWVMLPVQDIGMRIGPRKTDLIGTNPGYRFSLFIEREAGKDNVSDPLMLQDLTLAVSECITSLRKKDIFRCIRERAMGSLGLQIKSLTNRTGFDTDTVMKLIFDCVSVCYPGIQMRTAVVSQDFKALHYSHYGKFGGNVAHRRTTLYQNQSSDWELIGRTLVKSLITSRAADFAGKIVTTFDPLPLCRFPRFSIPLRSGDAALGFFQVEDFDIQKGGLGLGTLPDESEMRGWFESIGDLCGAALYTGNELKALSSIDDFCKCWNSSINGLIADLAHDSFSVVQGCRMMEILSIDEEYNIQSLLERKPAATKLPGNTVVLESITFKVHKEEIVEKSTHMGRRFSAIGAGGVAAVSEMFKRRGSVFGGPKPEIPAVIVPAPAAEAEEAIRSDLSRQYTANEDMVEEAAEKKYMLVGVRYDGLEQVHSVEFNEEAQSYTIPATHITIKSDRVVMLSLYEVDELANILNEYVGKINFATFQETELSASLCAPLPAGAVNFSNPVMFDATAAIHWPTKFVFTGEHKERTNIKGFNLCVKRARDLMGDKHNHADPFCEIIVGTKMIKQTEVKKKTTTPVWEEDVLVPYDGHSNLIIDVYNMNFLRKGDFLGRVEIPHEHLLNSTGDEVDYPLLLKPNVDAKKQTKVGGTLTLACSIVEHAPRGKKAKAAAAVVTNEDGEVVEEAPVEIPKEVWSMLCPTLHLTVKSATDLARANMFGGASDPFVLIFLGNDTEPIEKTHFIDNTLNPKWNSTFDILLGVTLERGVTTVANFPTLRLEVYDYNKVKTMDFLGSCEITPAMYFSSPDADMPLVAMPKKKSSLVKGNLQAEFSVFDKIVQHQSHVYSFTPMRSLQTILAVEVHILKARGLTATTKVGNSDPYVVLKWNNLVCGQTSVKVNTLNPSWNGEKFVVNILTHGGFDVGEMVMEVWHKDFFKDGDFLGETRVTSDIFMHPPSTSMDLPLMPKSGDNKALVAVAGTLTVKFNVNVVLQRPPCQQRTAVEYKMEPPKLDAVKLLMAYDTDAEAKRQKKEGVQFNSIMEKVSAQMERYLNNPFERTGLISELHFGQLTAASRRAEQTVLKTPLVDMICVPTYQRGARPDQCFYLMARYDAGKIPRRDMEFMGKIRKRLNQGLTHINEREGRLNALAELEKGMEVFSKATDNTSGLIVQTMLDLEVTLNCVAKLYLLGQDGITLTKCSVDIGEVDPETPPADDFIHNAAHVCRHGVLIQKYRRDHSVVSLQWENFTQLTMPPLQSMAVAFDELEKPNIVKDIISAGEGAVPDGAIIAPLMAHGEVFVGLLCLSKIDGTPCANYRVVPQVEPTSLTEVVTSTKGKPAESAATKKKPYEVVEKLEHGYTNKIKNACRHFADGIVTSRLGTLYRKIKSFPIKADTDPLKVIRYAFRLLVIAIPAIRTISVWGVNMSREPVLIFSKPEEAAPAPGIFSRLVSMSSRMSISSRLSSRMNSTMLLSTEGRLSQLMGLSSKKVPTVEPPPPSAPVVKPAPAIVAGMFGTEHPEFLLAAPIERAAFGANEQRLNTRYSAVGGHHNIINAVKDKNNEKHARWKVDVPGVIRKATQALNAIEEDDEDDDESFGSENSSAAGDSKANAPTSEFEDNAMNMIHAEIIRCTKVLQSKTFRILTGHILSAVGSSDQSLDILHSFFPQPVVEDTPPPPPSDNSYSDATPSAATMSSLRSIGTPARAPLPPEPAPVVPSSPATGRANTLLASGRVPPGGANAVPRRLPPNAAPLPAGAPSSSADKDKSGSSAATGGRNLTIDGNAPLLQRRARPPPTLIAQSLVSKKKKSPLRYFVAVNTNGIGGESGWGVMGESMEKIVSTITDLIETNLMKLAEAKTKADNDNSRASPSKPGASATTPGKSVGVASAYGGSEDNSWLRPSQMSEMEENSIDAESNSEDMEEID